MDDMLILVVLFAYSWLMSFINNIYYALKQVHPLAERGHVDPRATLGCLDWGQGRGLPLNGVRTGN